MNAKTNAQLQKDHRDRRVRLGLKQFRFWIEPEKMKILKEVAQAIREGKKVTIHEVTPNSDATTSEKG